MELISTLYVRKHVANAPVSTEKFIEAKHIFFICNQISNHISLDWELNRFSEEIHFTRSICRAMVKAKVRFRGKKSDKAACCQAMFTIRKYRELLYFIMIHRDRCEIYYYYMDSRLHTLFLFLVLFFFLFFIFYIVYSFI